MDQSIGNVFQVLGYIIGPILLGLAMYYGIQKSWGRKAPAIRDVQEKGTQRVYAEGDEELKHKTEAAKNSSNPIDVIERKTDTTG
jgi:hypothetical protein